MLFLLVFSVLSSISFFILTQRLNREGSRFFFFFFSKRAHGALFSTRELKK